MRQLLHHLYLPTRGRGMHAFTDAATDWLRREGAGTGLLTIFSRHTSASLLIQENYDPDVQADLERFFARLVPDGDPLFEHVLEGPDDMPAHVRTALTQAQLSIPVEQGRMLLGTWQGLYLYEHRRAPQQRHVVLHWMGE